MLKLSTRVIYPNRTNVKLSWSGDRLNIKVESFDPLTFLYRPSKSSFKREISYKSFQGFFRYKSGNNSSWQHKRQGHLNQNARRAINIDLETATDQSRAKKVECREFQNAFVTWNARDAKHRYFTSRCVQTLSYMLKEWQLDNATCASVSRADEKIQAGGGFKWQTAIVNPKLISYSRI